MSSVFAFLKFIHFVRDLYPARPEYAPASGKVSPAARVSISESQFALVPCNYVSLESRRTKRDKKPIWPRALVEMIGSLSNDAICIRDRALLLVGFALGFRHSELVSLDWEHLDCRDEGLAILLGRSKNDPGGVGIVNSTLNFAPTIRFGQLVGRFLPH